MNSLRLLFYSIFVSLLLLSCVDSVDHPLQLRGRLNVIVVDGTITNLAEPQVIQISRSKADPVSGQFYTTPVAKATVEVVVDSSQVVVCHETVDGSYRPPSDFKGYVGHTYQLRFTLSDGTRYASDQQVMPAEVAIARVYQRFNATSLPAQRSDGRVSRIRGASDVYIDWQDPASVRNYYRWEWTLWERQDWCRSCGLGYYLIWNNSDNSQLYEDCYFPKSVGGAYGPSQPYYVNDYPCRTRCWAIFYNYDLNLFDDNLSNGGQLTKHRVAQIPYYQHTGCLVEVRQVSVTKQAHAYFEQLQQQTQNNGGVADAPPAVPIGNVRNMTNRQEPVVGYFTASAVSAVRYWLDRRDATGQPPGLFEALSDLKPSPEDILVDPNNGRGKPPYPGGGGVKNDIRPPTAVCTSNAGQTPFKPVGWQD